MPDTKITALTAISTVDPAVDVLPIVDVSDTTMAASGTTKKITSNQILGAGGTATLASATITGDLTVRTNKLAVTSTGVGAGTATPLYPLHLVGEFGLEEASPAGTGSKLRFIGDATKYNFRIGKQLTANNSFEITPSTAAGGTTFSNPVYTVSYDGIHTFLDGAGSTRMTLNATGLGIGASPTQKLHVKGVVNFEQVSGGTNGWQVYTYTDGTYRMNYNGAGADELIIDTSGNVGIGVTPSAWSAGYKSIDIGGGLGLSGLSSQAFIGCNAYDSSGWKKKAAGYANLLLNTSGEYRFHVSTTGAGSAGDAISFVQAMTLDASGNLLVGKTSASVTTVGFQTLANGEASTAMSSSTNSATTWNVYSTGAAAYRFYVGMGGTVYATNTTISAISDQRLKENVQDIDVGLGAILALKPRKFDWKAGKGKNIKGDRGFIAQEFEQVFPQLVDEWADPAPEGETPYKSVRQDLIPVLVKAIQELTARVQTLETR